MADDWLERSAASYNKYSLETKDDYAAILLMPVDTLSEIIEWTFRSLPDEILVGIDPDVSRPHPDGVNRRYTGTDFQSGLFAGQGMFSGHLIL